MQKMEILLHKKILCEKVRSYIFALQIELSPEHDLFPVIHDLDFDILSKEVYLLYLFVLFYFLCKFVYGIKLIFFFFVVSDSSQRDSQIFFLVSIIVINDVKAIRPSFSVHVAKLFVKLLIVLKNLQILK